MRMRIIIDPAVDGFSDEVAITLRISLGPGRERRLPRFRGGFVHPSYSYPFFVSGYTLTEVVLGNRTVG